MKNWIVTGLSISLLANMTVSCNDSSASSKTADIVTNKKEEIIAPVKKDSAAVGSIQTATYEMKLHRAFVFTPSGSEVLAGFKPKEGHKFMYLDVSMKNIGSAVLDGGEIFIALKVIGSDHKEYKKPAAALAAYTSENPAGSNLREYNALWEKFDANEFHREIVFAVEVPADMNAFTLRLPTDRSRNEWKELKFSL